MGPTALERSAWRAVAAAAILAATMACGGGTETDAGRAPDSAPAAGTLPAPRTLGDVGSVDDLAKAFDSAQGRLRLVLLLSPT